MRPDEAHERTSARAHERTRAIVALTLLAALVGAYLAVRSSLRVPYLALLEYPIALVFIAFLVWQAVRRPRPRAVAQAQGPAPAQALRRHEQIVRTLPDPDAAALGMALASWIDTGAEPERAADIIARASAADPTRRDAERARLLPLVHEADSRKARARLVHACLNGVPGD